jgi:hypothetical protein
MDWIGETERLKTVAQQTRLKTIATELSLAFTWCAVARTEAEMAEHHRLQQSLSRIKAAANSLRNRIAEPGHVVPEVRREFESELSRLQVNLEELEAKAAALSPDNSKLGR